MASSRASMVASATNASTSTCSADCTLLARSSRLGGSTTTITDPIRAYAVSPRMSLQPGPPRAIRRTESNYELGRNGGKVTQRLLTSEAPASVNPIEVGKRAGADYIVQGT